MSGQTLLVTGGAGNLGTKLIADLWNKDVFSRFLCLDIRPPDASIVHLEGVEGVSGDLADPRDRTWQDAVAEADAVVHFAARNPYPDASWAESAASFDMTANLLEHAGRKKCRFVFASSNHVMGGYKDVDFPPNTLLNAATDPMPGTRVQGMGSPAYAVAKLMGERACFARAEGTNGLLTAVVMRIGWCQPGENRPQTISADGMPLSGTGLMDEEAARDLRWFRAMWLSNRDFLAETRAALTADASRWPGPAILVNAMSANRGSPWNMAPARELLGHVPQDDAFAELEAQSA